MHMKTIIANIMLVLLALGGITQYFVLSRECKHLKRLIQEMDNLNHK